MTKTALSSAPVRGTIAAALGILVCLLVVELGGAVYFYLRHGKVVYFNTAPAQATATTVVDDSEYKQRLHPYFGFAGPYSETKKTSFGTMYTNSLGFLQREPVQIPFARRDDDFVVALFGGSVAANLALAPRGGLQLRVALQRLPGLKEKRVVVLNMAQGSGKQPQQLIEFAYLLALGQNLDLALNVDGYNEFALAFENFTAGLDPILPAGVIIGGLAQEVLPANAGSVEYYEIAYQVSAAKRDIERRTASARGAHSGIAFLMDRALLTLNGMTLEKYLTKYNAAISAAEDWPARKKTLGLDMPVNVPDGKRMEALFDLWVRSSHQMQLMASGNQIGYLHIVQPNQYYSKKSFSDSEKRIALSLPAGHPYRVGLVDGYRMVVEHGILQKGPDVISAIPLFDQVTEDIYVDNCCHFNQRGETMFAEFVASRVSHWLTTAPRGRHHSRAEQSAPPAALATTAPSAAAHLATMSATSGL